MIEDGQMERQLLQAMEQNEVEITYQPMLRLNAKSQGAYRLIPTWRQGTAVRLSENGMRQLGNASGLQLRIDNWLVQRSMIDMRALRRTLPRGRLFLGLSAGSLLDEQFPTTVKRQLERHDLSSTGLVVEYRVQDIGLDINRTAANFRALKQLGLELCLTGLPAREAAFQLVRHLEVSYVVPARNMLQADAASIDLMLERMHKAGAKIILRGVDSLTSVSLHWSAGADYLQGNYAQPPLPQMDYDFTSAFS